MTNILSLNVRHFTCLNSFNPHNYPHSTIEEIEAQDDLSKSTRMAGHRVWLWTTESGFRCCTLSPSPLSSTKKVEIER